MWYIQSGLLLFIACMIHFKSRHTQDFTLIDYIKGFLIFTFLWPIAFPFYVIINIPPPTEKK